MANHNPKNERMKRHYLRFLRETTGKAEPSLDAVAAALHRFEVFTSFKDFAAFHHEQAIAFKRKLDDQKSRASGEPLSRSTICATLNALREFFDWLAQQTIYRCKFSRTEAMYFNPTRRDKAVARIVKDRPVPTLMQIKTAITAMPSATDIEMRDRAVIAFAIVSGLRDDTIASLRLKHVDIEAQSIFVHAGEVRAKNSKTITVDFFEVGQDLKDIVIEWVRFLKAERQWLDDDPLFPATRVEVDADAQFRSAGLARSVWSNAGPIRTIFKRAFANAGLPYFNPHSIRKTLTRMGGELSRTVEEATAWSQNLGHKNLATTLTHYGQLDRDRKRTVLRNIGSVAQARHDDAGLRRLITQALALTGPTADGGQ